MEGGLWGGGGGDGGALTECDTLGLYNGGELRFYAFVPAV